MATNLFLFAAFVAIMILMSFNFTKRKKRVLFFGDSITEYATNAGGFVTLLKEKLKLSGLNDKIELLSSGKGGDKLHDLLMRMQKDVLATRASMVFIFVGVNDVWHKQPAEMGFGYEQFKNDYETILQKLLRKEIEVIICTPALIGEKVDGENRQEEELNRYSDEIRNISLANNVQLVDFRKLFVEYNLQHNTENKEAGILTTDGVHLNHKGNELVATEFWKVISRLRD